MHTLTLARSGAIPRFVWLYCPFEQLYPLYRPSEQVPDASQSFSPRVSGFHVGFASGFFTPSRSHACRTPWSVFQDGTIATLLTGILLAWLSGWWTLPVLDYVYRQPAHASSFTQKQIHPLYTHSHSRGLSPAHSPYPDPKISGVKAYQTTSVKGTTLPTRKACSPSYSTQLPVCRWHLSSLGCRTLPN